VSEITIRAGGQYDETQINVDWNDHNNVSRRTTVLVSVLGQDKPRTLQITVNGVVVATIPADHEREAQSARYL